MADVNLRILLSAVGGGAVAGVFNDVTKAITGSGGLGGALAGISVAAAAVTIGLGGSAVKAAGDFQAQTERLVTSAGELQSNLGLVRDGILQMSVDTATSTEQLSAGMYYVESSGYHAAQGLQVLRVAAMGAKSENADLDVVTKALTTEMVDYHMKSTDAAGAMNGLIAAVQNGKTNLQDLASSMGAVLPIASSLGISFPQVAGAMDTMTNAGMSSRQAAMNLAHVLLSLSAPSGVAVKSMKEVGLSAQGVKDALANKGLPEALQMIEDAVGKKFPPGSVAYETALKNITGGIMGVKLAAELTGPSLDQTKQNIEKVAQSMRDGKNGVLGWNEVQSTFNFKMDQAHQAINAVFIKIGTALLPVLSNLLTSVTPLITKFGDWLVKSGALQGALNLLQTVFSGVSNAISTIISVGSGLVSFFQNNQWATDALVAVLITLAGIGLAFALTTIPPLIVGFFAWATAAGAAAIATLTAAAPIILIGLLIAALIFGIIMLVQHWKQVQQFAVMIWGHIVKFFQDDVVKPIGNLFNQLGTKVHGIITSIGGFFDGLGTKAHQVTTNVGNFFSGLGTKAHGIWDGARQKAGDFFSWLGTQGHNVTQGVGGAFSWLGTQVHGKINDIGGFFSWLGTQANNLLKTIQGIAGGIGQAFQDAGRWIGDKINSAMQAVKNAINWVIRGINNFINFLDGLHIQIPAINAGPIHIGGGSIGLPHIPDIPLLAAGGNVTVGGLAVVGEAGPELIQMPVGAQVIPLSGSSHTQVQGHTFNIYIDTMARSPSEVSRMVDLIEQELGRRVRLQTPGYNQSNIF